MSRHLLFALAWISILAPARAQLIAYLPFDGSAADASGRNVATSVVNATSTPSGYTGGAYAFNGTNSYVELSLDINPATLPRLTMGAWVLATSVSPIRQIISHDNGSFDRSVGLDNRGGLSGWSMFTGSGSVRGGEAASTGVWTFVAAVYDQPASTTTLYVNGNAYSATGVTLGSGWTFTRVGMNPTYGEYFSGTIDEVFIFAEALTAPQIATIRTSGVLALVPETSGWSAVAGLTALVLVALGRRTRRTAR